MKSRITSIVFAAMMAVVTVGCKPQSENNNRNPQEPTETEQTTTTPPGTNDTQPTDKDQTTDMSSTPKSEDTSAGGTENQAP